MLIGDPPTATPPATGAERIFESVPPSEIEATKGPSGKRLLIVAMVLGILAVVGVLFWRFASKTEAPTFQLTQLQKGTIESTVSATGACNAVVDVQVGSQVSGNIKALYADFNTRVKAGQLVALIDPEIFEAKVKQADAALRNAKAALENAKAAGAKAESDLSGAHAAEANQVAAIAKAKVALADANTKLARRVTLFNEQILSKE